MLYSMLNVLFFNDQVSVLEENNHESVFPVHVRTRKKTFSSFKIRLSEPQLKSTEAAILVDCSAFISA